MKTTLWIFVFCALCFNAKSGFAMTGEQLLEWCQYSGKATEEMNFVELRKSMQCETYISGVMDGHTKGLEDAIVKVLSNSAIPKAVEMYRMMICLPENVTNIQLHRLVAK